jgi:hypothetical protein
MTVRRVHSHDPVALHAPEELGFDVTVRDRNARVGVAAGQGS